MEQRHVLARSLRPQNFEQMIGQSTASKVLSNAILSQRIPHALLLTGSRGTGKTTTARIWAKCLNCLQQDHPTPVPCNQCKNCLAITEGNHLEICEVDAGSHTGTQEIQDLLEQAEFAPQTSRMRVCILDEVHMLSSRAFESLRRTLGEQHPGIKFVLATTESQKIPQNIRSQTLHVHLGLIPREEIQALLSRACQEQSIQIQEPALEMISVCANGSLRDALSLLDRAASHARDEVLDLEGLQAILGTQDPSQHYMLFQHITRGRIQEAILLARSLYQAGESSGAILESLASLCHLASAYKVSPEITLTPFERENLPEISESLQAVTLKRFYHILEKTGSELLDSKHPQLQLEMMLIQMTHSSQSAQDYLVSLLPPLEPIEYDISKAEPEPEADLDPQTRETQAILKAFPGAKITIKEK